MALPEVPNYDASVYEILVTDAVEGYNPANPNTAANVGISNQAALNLANRTNWLYTNLNLLISGENIPSTVAPLLSPVFTGTPEAPTPSLGDNSVKLSTTAFVQGTVNGLTAINVAGGSNVALTSVQAGSGILNFTGALTANIAVLLPNTSGKWIVENNTTGAFTLTVKTAAGTGVAVTQGKNQCVFGDGTNIYLASNDFANMVLSGQPTTTTPPIGDQSLKIANTDFVWQFVDGAVNVPVGGGSNVTLTPAQYGNGILLLQGALTAAIAVELPHQSGQWIVANQTTGAFGLTMAVSGATGATATIPQGQSVIVYSDGTNVILAGAAASSSFAIHTFTATQGQTDFACPYTPGNILVIRDGSTVSSANFTATDGANVIFATAATAGEEINVIAFSSFTVANAVTWDGGTMLGALQLFGGDTGATAAQFNSSTLLATTAFVQGALGNLSGFYSIAASETLSPSQAGSYVVCTASGATVTLPLGTSMTPGALYTIQASSAGPVTVSSQNGNFAGPNGPASGSASLTLQATSCSSFLWSGSGWIAFGGSGIATLTANGYQRLPSGLIIQWGLSGSMSGSTFATVSVTFPIAFPNAGLQCFATSTGAGVSTAAGGASTTGVTLTNSTTATSPARWLAIGY